MDSLAQIGKPAITPLINLFKNIKGGKNERETKKN